MSSVLLKPDKEYRVGKIMCVGQNYLLHVEEMKSKRGKNPLLFMKPSTAILNEGYNIVLPDFSEEVHYETELALLIGKEAKNILPLEWQEYVIGAGIALDLTLRDLQYEAKKSGYPWTIAKGFDGSCPISSFVPLESISDIHSLEIELSVNNTMRQQGNTANMIWPVAELVSYISKIFTLEEGDVVLTGTPSGVGKIYHGDHLHAQISEVGEMTFKVN